MSQIIPVKLPIDLSQTSQTQPAADRDRLLEINQQFSELKSRLKEVELEKGILSRKIGDAKKSGQPADQFIQGTKQTSAMIKSIKSDITQLQIQATEILNQHTEQVSQPALPGHFSPKRPPNQSLSNVSIVVAQASDAERWTQYVESHPNSSVYHRYEFQTVIQKSFGHHTIYLMALDDNNAVQGILPAVQLNSPIFGNYVVAMPYFNYGGALASSEDIEQQLMKQLTQQALELEATHIEFRDTQPQQNYLQKTEKCSLILQLPDTPEKLWDQIGTKVRAQIKKAESTGLSFKTGKQELLKDFYHVFAINMRDLGTPVYSIDFFKNILNTPQLDTRLAIVYHENRPVSCAFLIAYKGTMEIPWASTIRKANPLNANMFLYWNVLSAAIEAGNSHFDFGRSSKDANTFKFKTQWGAKPIQLFWHYWLKDSDELPELNPNNPKYKIAISIWKKLPIFITKIIGPHLVKYLP